MRENISFVLKVTAAHVATYLVCGLIFAWLFDYESLFAMDGVLNKKLGWLYLWILFAVLGIVCALAAAPTAYNYLTGSPLRSPLSLVFSGLPVEAIGVYFCAKRSKARTTEIPR